MPRPTVLVASHYDRQVIAEPLRRLSAWADARDAYRGRCLTREELLDHLPGAHAVIASDEVYDEAILESAGHLTMIARDGTGYDAIDLDAATRLGILVTRAPVLQDATANTTIGLMIALVRKIAVADRDLRDGRWNERDRWLAPDLTGLTLCVVGFGQVGKAVAKRAAALGMEVSTVHLADLALTSNEAGTSDDIDKIVAAADIVSLHLRLSPQTSRIIGAHFFDRMRRGAYFINTARGGLVDEAALHAALAGGRLAGAALDVFDEEPVRPDHPLLALDNVLCTPHFAGDTTTTMAMAVRTAMRQIEDGFAGRKPQYIVNDNAWTDARVHDLADSGIMSKNSKT